MIAHFLLILSETPFLMMSRVPITVIIQVSIEDILVSFSLQRLMTIIIIINTMCKAGCSNK